MITYVSRRLNIFCIKFKITTLFPYNNAPYPVKCEGWYFINM